MIHRLKLILLNRLFGMTVHAVQVHGYDLHLSALQIRVHSLHHTPRAVSQSFALLVNASSEKVQRSATTAFTAQWKVNMIDDHFQSILISNRSYGYRILTFGQAVAVSKKYQGLTYYITELLVFPFPIHHIHIIQHNITSLHL